MAVLCVLGAAEKHFADAGTDRPAWCSWVSEADLAVDSGQALLDLGDTGRAHQFITEGEQLLPVARDKTRGVFLTCQAASHLDQMEPESAAAAATQALLLARRIGPPRCTCLVEALLPRFQPATAPQADPAYAAASVGSPSRSGSSSGIPSTSTTTPITSPASERPTHTG